jgi:ribosomal protein S12 methylthiotransferase accessory factor
MGTVLDITIDDELDIDDYVPNLNRMYGSEIMENVVGSVTGDVKFPGLTKTSMKLEGLDKHLKLIESYKKLHKARGLQH